MVKRVLVDVTAIAREENGKFCATVAESDTLATPSGRRRFGDGHGHFGDGKTANHH